MRIGSLAVRMVAFSCAWLWRSGRGGLHWGGVRCGAEANALLRQSRDTAEALSEMFLVAPCALSEGKSAKPWTFAVFAALSPLIDTSQMWVAFAQILPLAMRIRWSLSLIFLDFKCVTMWI